MNKYQTIPLTQFGKPDLQGFWSNASLTKMERDPAYAEFGLLIPNDKINEIKGNYGLLGILTGARQLERESQ